MKLKLGLEVMILFVAMVVMNLLLSYLIVKSEGLEIFLKKSIRIYHVLTKSEIKNIKCPFRLEFCGMTMNLR